MKVLLHSEPPHILLRPFLVSETVPGVVPVPMVPDSKWPMPCRSLIRPSSCWPRARPTEGFCLRSRPPAWPPEGVPPPQPRLSDQPPGCPSDRPRLSVRPPGSPPAHAARFELVGGTVKFVTVREVFFVLDFYFVLVLCVYFLVSIFSVCLAMRLCSLRLSLSFALCRLFLMNPFPLLACHISFHVYLSPHIFSVLGQSMFMYESRFPVSKVSSCV